MLKMSIALVVVYAVCVLPQHLFWFLMTFTKGFMRSGLAPYVFPLSNLLMILNSAINPVIYGTLNDEIKKGVGNILLCKPDNISESVSEVLSSIRRVSVNVGRRASVSVRKISRPRMWLQPTDGIN